MMRTGLAYLLDNNILNATSQTDIFPKYGTYQTPVRLKKHKYTVSVRFSVYEYCQWCP
jgi:hypothetical protein